jgi:hypothetical protein
MEAGALTGLRYDSSSTKLRSFFWLKLHKIMKLLLAPALQHWFVRKKLGILT